MIFTASETVTLYREASNTGAFYLPRMKAGDFANVLVVGSTWHKVYFKGNEGFVEDKRGTLEGSPVPVPDNPPPPVPSPLFPKSFILTEPNGNKAEYVFVRVIE